MHTSLMDLGARAPRRQPSDTPPTCPIIGDDRKAEPPLDATVDGVLAHLRAQWRQGNRVTVETYLAMYPELQTDPGLFALVYGEFLIREELGDKHTVAEYQQRFPRFADQLAQQVQIHHALASLRGAPPRNKDGGFNPRVIWSTDGQRLAVSNWNRTVSIWDAAPRHLPESKQAQRQAAESRPPLR